MFNAVLTVSVQKIAYVAYMPFVPCSIAGMPTEYEVNALKYAALCHYCQLEGDDMPYVSIVRYWLTLGWHRKVGEMHIDGM